MRRSALKWLLAFSMLGAPACHRRAHQAQPRPSVVAKVVDDGTRKPGENKQGLGNGTGAGLGENADEEVDNPNQRFHEATVYVDGVPRIAFTYNEMPPTVKVMKWDWSGEGDFAYHMLVSDYLKSLGIDINKVKATHWYGGRDRVVVLEGDELRKHKNDLFFNFTRDTFGKPRLEWRNGVKTNDMVDIITDLAVYIDKKPPRWDKELWSIVDDDGNPIDQKIPYNQEEMPRRSVRINVDGRYATYLKRNLLEGNLTPVNTINGVVPKDEMPRYKLNELLASKRLPTKHFRGMDLITRDERVIRLSPSDCADVEFTLQRHGGGVAEFEFKGEKAYAKSVNIYVALQPPNRPMRTYTLTSVGRQARRGGGDSQSQVQNGQ